MADLNFGIPGLGLVLGGGLRMIQRPPGQFASGSILLRGPPGSGKTLLGAHLAAGAETGDDVAYGCVEVLPVELHEQFRAFNKLGPIIVTPPYVPKAGTSRRLFAGLLDLGSSGESRLRLEDAILSHLGNVRRAGGRPRVLVIDSLSDGYRLGSSVPRELADAICKLAAVNDLLLILLEETTDRQPSPWSFAVDTVLELASGETSPWSPIPSERWLTVVKNRLNPSEPGPHQFLFRQTGVDVFPRPLTYIRPWTRGAITPAAQEWAGGAQRWPASGLDDQHGWTAPVRGSVVAVHGSNSMAVRAAAAEIGLWCNGDGARAGGTDIIVDIGGRWVGTTLEAPHGEVVRVGPLATGPAVLAELCGILNGGSPRLQKGQIRRVLVGDVRAVRSLANAESLNEALPILASLFRDLRVPVVFFATTAPDGGEATTAPVVADLADVEINVGGSYPTDAGHRAIAVISHRASGRWTRWEVALPEI